ncbi:ABC transporter ATP-binding protein [Amycolatopsis sp. CA-230715]|uniref:ABC transporter ATP-binding protein n=1 Tax=Amycolatopsis sp. CA-230715 TaxID=2745196 RepID=UPI001C00CC51|nr:ATP-binding cassette domain-containing protein [Amycolatopsis sp. CA-230715]QWF85273.1 putative ABC transporter ATP-binding protein YejF [Amycolatopsis sp. CA-230715]
MNALDLTEASAHAGEAVLLDGITLGLRPGRVVAVVGGSGAGKTTLGLAALGQSRPGVRLTGSVRLGGAELLVSSTVDLRRARAGVVGHLPQQPSAVLDPGRRCGSVLTELAALRVRGRAARVAAGRAALDAAGLDAGLWRRFPHQLSGGQQQRMALATALVTRPRLLVLDEPTSALHLGARGAFADLVRELTGEGVAFLVLTHDFALVRDVADEVAVLHEGRLVEAGETREVLTAPVHPVTRALVGARPVSTASAAPSEPMLIARGLTVRAGRRALIEDVDLELPAGSRTALVGSSGAGKTTVARALAGLAVPSAGTVELDGAVLPSRVRRRSTGQLRAIQYVHQDTRASFDEFRPVLGQIADTARRLRGLDGTAARAEALDVVRALGVEAVVDRRPGSLSGGQLQRCALARALLARPRLLVCDEVTSALDPVTAADVLGLVAEVAARWGTALLMIGHDRAATDAVTDRTVLIEDGRLR